MPGAEPGGDAGRQARPGTVTLTPGAPCCCSTPGSCHSRDRARAEVLSVDDQPEEILLRVAFGAELVLAVPLRRLTDDASSVSSR